MTRLGEPLDTNKITYRIRENLSEGRNYHLHLDGFANPKTVVENRKVVVIGQDRRMSYSTSYLVRTDEDSYKADVRTQFAAFANGIFGASDHSAELASQKLSGIDVLYEGKNNLTSFQVEETERVFGLAKTPTPKDKKAFSSSVVIAAEKEGRVLECVIAERYHSNIVEEPGILLNPGGISEIRAIGPDEKEKQTLVMSTATGEWRCTAYVNMVQTKFTIGDLLTLGEGHHFRLFTPGHKELINKRIYKVDEPKSIIDRP